MNSHLWRANSQRKMVIRFQYNYFFFYWSCELKTSISGKCCPNCNDNHISNVEDDNNQGEINTNHRKYNADDDDDISELHNNVTSDNSDEYFKTQNVVSESCNTFSNKLNRNKLSVLTCNEEKWIVTNNYLYPKYSNNNFCWTHNDNWWQ